MRPVISNLTPTGCTVTVDGAVAAQIRNAEDVQRTMAGMILPDADGIQWTYSLATGDFEDVTPAPVSDVPEKVNNGSLRVALIGAGISPSSIDAIIAGMPAGQAKDISDTLWRYQSEVRRDHPLVAGIQGALGLTSAQVDDIFRVAAQV